MAAPRHSCHPIGGTAIAIPPASRATVARFVQGGVIPASTNAVLSETHRTWNRPEAAELAKLYALVVPNFQAAAESYQKAGDVAKQTR